MLEGDELRWYAAVLTGFWASVFVLGLVHSLHLVGEPSNPLVHTTRDWVIGVPVLILGVSVFRRLFSWSERSDAFTW